MATVNVFMGCGLHEAAELASRLERLEIPFHLVYDGNARAAGEYGPPISKLSILVDLDRAEEAAMVHAHLWQWMDSYCDKMADLEARRRRGAEGQV